MGNRLSTCSEIVRGLRPATREFPFFLQLPPEIRNMIYKYVLVSDKPFSGRYIEDHLTLNLQLLEKGRLPAETKLALARVCKQINQEALSIYFGKNTFKFYRSEYMTTCLTALSQTRRNLIKNVCFAYSGKKRTAAMKMLGQCRRLQRLEIEVSELTTFGSNWRKTGICDLCVSTGLKQLLKIRGCKEVVVRYEMRSAFQGAPLVAVTAENVEKFEDLVKKELCKELGEI